jgi:hypothetical protein
MLGLTLCFDFIGSKESIKSNESNSIEASDECPVSLLKNVPIEATKLKEEVEKRKQLLWSKKV